jgi:hypothetical protein
VPAADQRAAITTLQEAVKQYDAWTKDFDFGATCPACQRKGLPRAHLAKHLETCPLHPAVRGARARAAIDTLRTGVEGPRLALGQYDPEDYRDRLGDYGRQQRDNAVRKLITFEPSELSADEVRTLTWFVSDWEELEVIAQTPPCPWCGTSKPGEAHLLQCAKHPARGAEGPWDGLEATAARLQHEADRLEVRLARLHEACSAFWNGMRDGEDGKSISNDRIEEMWSLAREEAKEVLADLPE